MRTENTRLTGVLGRALEWAKKRNYTGWEKHDGLNSPVLKTLLGWGKWPRLLAIQGIMRFPFNLRPFLGVRKHKNPKGAALFARAWLNFYSITRDKDHLKEACRLLDWLVQNPAPGSWPGLSWGYPYPWQDMGFYAISDFPNRIVTYFVGRALVHGYEATGDRRYLDGARESVEFILKAPKVLYADDAMLCLSYVPVETMTMAVMDVSALCGALCAMTGKHTSDETLTKEARRLMNWVADKQTEYGAWYYTHPAGESHITHDNYHTGEILDAFLEYQRYSNDHRFDEIHSRGLKYYSSSLFTERSRPKWMNDREYPHDAHGYSQGIITFAMAGDLERSGNIATSALEDIWDEEQGRFYWQRKKHTVRKLTFMRWCQGWMAFALSILLLKKGTRGMNQG